MSISVRATKDRLNDVRKAVAALTQNEVVIGIPDIAATRTNDDGKAASNALIGYVLENGSPVKNIPARPFLVPGVASIKDQIATRLKEAAAKALDGNGAAVENAFEAVGLAGQAAVRKQMTDGSFAPLAPATLAARRRKGRTGDKPLLDTGALRQAITYVVRKHGAD